MPLSSLQSSPSLAIATTAGDDPADQLRQQKLQQLATQLALPICHDGAADTTQGRPDCQGFDFLLSYAVTAQGDSDALSLRSQEPGLGGAISVDFVHGRLAHRRQFGGGRGQPLARAIGLKAGANPSVVDATAGLGRDAFVLASLGARVTLLERSAIVAALLQDGLGRLASHPEHAAIAANMHLVHTNAIAWLRQCAQPPEVVYLDPMYPQRDKSALVKKEMRVIRALVGADQDIVQLFEAARHCARRRVVVKRPKTAPPLTTIQPSGCVESKNTRYEIYPAEGA
jgi:16S rRNA (guanine1516-N2)-methyltransferase